MTATARQGPDDVLRFWFGELVPAQYYARSDALDAEIGARFGALHGAAGRCELFGWRATPAGRLAEIIVLDQFSRNIFRDNRLAFADDKLALALAQTAVQLGIDAAFPADRRAFFYLPYMHSESSVIHRMAVSLFGAPGLENNLEYELRHKAIIDRFGRYPHRNNILGRESTPAEIAFLQIPGSSF